MSNLVEHAKRELSFFDNDPWIDEGIINVVQAFADMGHSGGSASWAIPVINELLQFKNLRPLTDDPGEWMVVGGTGVDRIWQSQRNSEAFSNDGGKTFYLLSEGGNFQKPSKIYNSEKKEVK